MANERIINKRVLGELEDKHTVEALIKEGKKPVYEDYMAKNSNFSFDPNNWNGDNPFNMPSRPPGL